MRREGRSYREIHQALSIPKATLSGWLSGADWSRAVRARRAKASEGESAARLRALNAIRGEHLAAAYAEAGEEARKEFEALKHHPLFIAGVTLYWGEGQKLGRHRVKLTNTDPKMIRLYIAFLLDICSVPKTRINVQLLLYPDHRDKESREYWRYEAGLEDSWFAKSTVIKGKHPSRRLPHGVCIVTVSSAYLKVKIDEWLRLLPGELMNRSYYENI